MKNRLSCATSLSALLCLTLLAPWTGLTAQQTAIQTAPLDQQEFDLATQLESFDVVWNTIKKTHWNPALVGESWDAARDKFRPAIDAYTKAP